MNQRELSPEEFAALVVAVRKFDAYAKEGKDDRVRVRK